MDPDKDCFAIVSETEEEVTVCVKFGPGHLRRFSKVPTVVKVVEGDNGMRSSHLTPSIHRSDRVLTDKYFKEDCVPLVKGEAREFEGNDVFYLMNVSGDSSKTDEEEAILHVTLKKEINALGRRIIPSNPTGVVVGPLVAYNW